MNRKIFGFALCLLGGLLLMACKEEAPKVPPLSIDLPVSFKSDSAAYYFVKNQNEVWSAFGKKVESMYRKAEKFRQKEFNALSQRELLQMLNMEHDYILLWLSQEVHLTKLTLEASLAINAASDQGAAKVLETQRLVMDYYLKLVETFGMELHLDKEPYIFTPEEDSLNRMRRDSLIRGRFDGDSVNQFELDSLLHLLMMSQPQVK